jgi:hypothetical protein
MPTFLMMSRHSPESCPMVNERTRKVYVNWLSKIDEINKKYKMKVLWMGGIPSEHLSIFIMEAPSLELFEKASMDPENIAMMATETMEIKSVMSMTVEETIKMFKSLK